MTLNERTLDQSPGLPPASFARTRQNRVALGSDAVASCEGVTVWLSTVEEKLLEALTWIVYEAAPATSLQSKATV